MEVILRSRVHGLGALGDRVQVRPGYGRNYLVPRGLAVPATEEHIRRFEAERAELESQQRDREQAALSRGETLDALPVIAISRKAGPEGRLFGSVSNVDIAAAVVAAGVELGKNEVSLPDGPLRMLGEHQVRVRLSGGVAATLTLNIVAE